MLNKLLGIICIATFLGSCKKDVGDATSPKIVIASPTNHQSFTAGQAVAITATITDDDEIHEVHLFVTNKATSAEILHFEEHTDSKTYLLSKTFTVQAGVTYVIKIEASDHADNESEVDLEVTGN